MERDDGYRRGVTLKATSVKMWQYYSYFNFLTSPGYSRLSLTGAATSLNQRRSNSTCASELSLPSFSLVLRQDTLTTYFL